MKEHLQEMVEIIAIRKSVTPWASKFVLVRKKNAECRLCIDLCKLNERTIKDGYALPRVQDTLLCLHGTIWFPTLDLQSGHWQVELEEEAEFPTAFALGLKNFGNVKECILGSSIHQIPSKVDGIMPQWDLFDLLYHLFRWHQCFSQTLKEHLARHNVVSDKWEGHSFEIKTLLVWNMFMPCLESYCLKWWSWTHKKQ